MIIRDNAGRQIGYVEQPAIATNVITGGQIPGSSQHIYPAGIVRKFKRWCGFAVVGFALLVLISAAFKEEAAENAAVPLTTIGATDPAAPALPAAVPSLQQVTGTENGPSTIVAGNGAVMLNGVQVDNVARLESPTRARYLALIPQEMKGRESATVSEGIAVCMAITDGSSVALREAQDARSGVSEFGTGDRRMKVVYAALEVFCPRYK